MNQLAFNIRQYPRGEFKPSDEQGKQRTESETQRGNKFSTQES